MDDVVPTHAVEHGHRWMHTVRYKAVGHRSRNQVVPETS